jgi:hypothetical protein
MSTGMSTALSSFEVKPTAKYIQSLLNGVIHSFDQILSLPADSLKQGQSDKLVHHQTAVQGYAELAHSNNVDTSNFFWNQLPAQPENPYTNTALGLLQLHRPLHVHIVGKLV